jgi:hypothetical protein
MHAMSTIEKQVDLLQEIQVYLTSAKHEFQAFNTFIIISRKVISTDVDTSFLN